MSLWLPTITDKSIKEVSRRLCSLIRLTVNTNYRGFTVSTSSEYDGNYNNILACEKVAAYVF
jgi:hypothetical protein